MKNNQIPCDPALSSARALMRDGFTYIQKRCRFHDSDLFEIRLPGQRVVCMTGQEAAQIFYDPALFVRKNAIPKRVQKTLLGQNAIQTIDGTAHAQRKSAFMSLMTPENIRQLIEMTEKQWHNCLSEWEKADRVVLFEQVQHLLCRVACDWACVPLKESEVAARARDFICMVDAFGAVGIRHWKGRFARGRAERWIKNLISDIRDKKIQPPADSAAYTFAWYRDEQGKLLSTKMAAVELINVLRPIVAITYYIAFTALALHDYPSQRQKLMKGSDSDFEFFVQEVRRFYPFAPFIGAKVKQDFDWNGCHFEKGNLVMLDIYGTNHDARIWKKPDSFQPERFRNTTLTPFNFMPQGGGHHHNGHRCAGEQVTVEVMKLAARLMTAHMEYDVPGQNLYYDLSRMPAFPESGFVMTKVRRVAPQQEQENRLQPGSNA